MAFGPGPQVSTVAIRFIPGCSASDTERQFSGKRIDESRDRCRAKALPKLWSNYGPAIVSEYAKTAFGSHPRRVLSIGYDPIVHCHGTARWNGRELEDI